ncbi:MAG: hypothetical protein ACRERC_05790 [Candidatus Binatia bacterium]
MALQHWRRAVSLALTLAIALLTAPLTRVMGRDCQLCPPACPMHATHGEPAAAHGHETVAKKPTCHGVPAAQHAAAARADRQGVRLTRPPCGNHSAVAGVAVAPMILPAVLPWRVVQAVEPATLEARTMRDRLNEPPDTPPPIRAA